MVITEYNEEVFVNGIREEGREEGRTTAITTSIKNVMKNLKCSAEQAMETLDIPQNERSKYMSI